MNEMPLEISVEDVSSLMARPERQPRLIDCREADEWQLCHIEGAELVPLSQFGELAPRRFQDTAQHLIIYCHHGMRSLRAASWLRQQGFTEAQSMHGGIEAWSQLIDPTVPRY